MSFLDPKVSGSRVRLRRTDVPGAEPANGELLAGEIAVNAADGTIFVGSTDGSAVAVGAPAEQFVSSGGIANLTSEQQAGIGKGSIVTTTDGRRWVYKGEGGKTLEASYIELADITPVWSAIADKPSTFTPSTHVHAISDVTNLQTALDGKQASGSYAAASHSHAISDITNLQTTLNGKASTSHSHAISDVTNLQTSLDAKVSSVTTGITGADQITNMVSLTQAEYDAIPTKSATTFYVITD